MQPGRSYERGAAGAGPQAPRAVRVTLNSWEAFNQLKQRHEVAKSSFFFFTDVLDWKQKVKCLVFRFKFPFWEFRG